MPARTSTRTPSLAAPPPVPAGRLLGSVCPPAPRGPGRFERSFRRQVAGQIRDVLTRGYVLRYSAALQEACTGLRAQPTATHLRALARAWSLARLACTQVSDEVLVRQCLNTCCATRPSCRKRAPACAPTALARAWLLARLACAQVSDEVLVVRNGRCAAQSAPANRRDAEE